MTVVIALLAANLLAMAALAAWFLRLQRRTRELQGAAQQLAEQLGALPRDLRPEVGEPAPASPFFTIEFLDPLVTEGYDNLWQIDTWNEEDVTTGWVEFRDVQTEQMDRFRGRSLPIQFDSRPGSSRISRVKVWILASRLSR